MKKTLLFLVVACGLSIGAVKASPDVPQPAGQVTRCEAVTGSRIASAPDAQGLCDTQAPFVRSYRQDDLQRTGEIDLDDALLKLDPALVSRGSFVGGASSRR